MKIDINDLIEYLECPLRYRFHQEGKPRRKSMKGYGFYSGTQTYLEFNEALLYMVHTIFHQLSNGTWPSLRTITSRWAKTWVRSRRLDEPTSWANERKNNEKRGLAWILRLLKTFEQDPGIPLLVGKEYRVKIGKHELTGHIDLVRERNGEIEILIFSVDDRARVLHSEMDLRATAASYAFWKLTGTHEKRIYFYGLKTGRFFETRRDTRDHQILETILDKVEKALEDGIIYPVLNFKCFECPYDKYCQSKTWIGEI